MDNAFRSPFVEIFRREKVEFEVRLQAAMGMLAPRPAEQLVLLVYLTGDSDETIASAAEASLSHIPQSSIESLLARPDAPAELREFFAARGIKPALTSGEESAEPLIDTGPEPPHVLGPSSNVSAAAPVTATDEAAANGDLANGVADAESEEARTANALQKIANLGVPQRVALAMKGTREERAILIRDTNKIVSLAVLSSPKLTDSEVESFARMTSVIEDIPRTIAAARSWSKNYGVCLALVKNPKTPLPVAMNLLPRLNEKDLRGLSTDRNIAELLRTTAKRKLARQ